jgi:hypothetical protein
MSILGLARDVISSEDFLAEFAEIDRQQAERVRGDRCPRGGCGGPLHWARFQRQPRGESLRGCDALWVRHGLCCGWCRRRVLPPSVLFWERRVYLGWALLLVGVAQQLAKQLQAELFELIGASGRTLARWRDWFRHNFPRSPQWQRIRGAVSAEVNDSELPGSWFDWVCRGAPSKEALSLCLRQLAGSEHAGSWNAQGGALTQ